MRGFLFYFILIYRIPYVHIDFTILLAFIFKGGLMVFAL